MSQLNRPALSILHMAQPLATEANVSAVLQESENPMRAVDIVRALTEKGIAATTTSINKILYSGPFTRGTGAGTAPTWTARREVPAMLKDLRDLGGLVSFKVNHAGAFILSRSVSDAQLDSLFAAIVTMVPPGENKIVHLDGTADGERVGRAANRVGFAAMTMNRVA